MALVKVILRNISTLNWSKHVTGRKEETLKNCCACYVTTVWCVYHCKVGAGLWWWWCKQWAQQRGYHHTRGAAVLQCCSAAGGQCGGGGRQEDGRPRKMTKLKLMSGDVILIPLPLLLGGAEPGSAAWSWS